MKKSYPLRIEESLFLKLQHIAAENSRSLNKEMEFLIKNAIASYEATHDEIVIDLDEPYK